MGLLSDFIDGNYNARLSLDEMRILFKTSLEINKKAVAFLENNTSNEANIHTKIRPATLVLADIEIILQRGVAEYDKEKSKF